MILLARAGNLLEALDSSRSMLLESVVMWPNIELSRPPSRQFGAAVDIQTRIKNTCYLFYSDFEWIWHFNHLLLSLILRLAAAIYYYGRINCVKLIFLARAGNLLEGSRWFWKHASSWTSARINSERMMNWLWLYKCMYICIYNYEHSFIIAKIWIIYSLFTYSKLLDVIICCRMPFCCTDWGWNY